MNNIYNDITKEITIHFVSDSTGETIDNAVSATVSQFPGLKKKRIFLAYGQDKRTNKRNT